MFITPSQTKARGFTLLEVGIAIALLAGLTALASASINSLSSAELRKRIGQLQGLTRDTYMRTALAGKPHRLVIDIEANSFWVEQAEGRAVVGKEKLEADRDGKIEFDKVDERIEDLDPGDDDPEDIVKKELYGGPLWGAVDDEFGKPTILPSDVRFDSVWVDHLREPIKTGKVAMIFFVGGYMQEAHITLREGEDDDDVDAYTLTLVTQPLTGETFIEREIPAVPR